MLNNKQQIHNQKHDFINYDVIEKMLGLKIVRQKSFGDVVNCMINGALGVFLGQALGMGTESLLLRKMMIWKMDFSRVRQLIRSTQYMISVFSSKIIIDQINIYLNYNFSQYTKGGLVGLFTYLINRPLDQLQLVKQQIYLNQNRHVTRLQSIRIVLKYDGFKGFYKYQNLIAPISSYIYRSIYFGLYHKLSKYSNNPINVYMLFPLITGLGAFISTISLDICRSIYVNIHKNRNQSLQKRSKLTIKEASAATEQFFNILSKGQYKDIILKLNPSILTLSILKNTIFLSTFILSQQLNYNFSLFQFQENKLLRRNIQH